MTDFSFVFQYFFNVPVVDKYSLSFCPRGVSLIYTTIIVSINEPYTVSLFCISCGLVFFLSRLLGTLYILFEFFI